MTVIKMGIRTTGGCPSTGLDELGATAAFDDMTVITSKRPPARRVVGTVAYDVRLSRQDEGITGRVTSAWDGWLPSMDGHPSLQAIGSSSMGRRTASIPG